MRDKHMQALTCEKLNQQSVLQNEQSRKQILELRDQTLELIQRFRTEFGIVRNSVQES